MHTKPKAYSYLRFSTPEQMKGDSMRRQSSLAVEYAAKHGLALDLDLTFNDLGVSAYRAKNAEDGALAVFRDLAEDGQIAKGSYLLVESLDRVSRTKPRKAVKILERICDAGINVVTLSDGRVYNEENLDNDGGLSLIMSVLIFVRANEESATKSKRLKAAWAGKRLAGGTKPLTSLGPSWLKLHKETGRWEVIEEKAAVVRRVFSMAAEGMGYARIATALTKEGVPTLSGKAAFWRHTTVRHLLNSSVVTGTYVPSTREMVNDKEDRRYLEPIPDYFPRIISDDLYNRVRITMARPRTGTWTHRNIFGGLVLCGRCGGSMTMQAKKNTKKQIYRYLVCVNARYGAGCKYNSVGIENVEQSFIRDLDRILARKPTESGAEEHQLSFLDESIDRASRLINSLEASFKRTGDTGLLSKLDVLNSEVSVLKGQRSEVLAKLEAASGPLVERRAAGLRAALAEEPRDAQKINAHLRAMFTGMSISVDTGLATIGWRGGGSSTFQFQMPLEAEPRYRRSRKNA